ncbi:MAG: cation diffusion facilitator family transporter [Pelistega sp.]|nr:cation diffusion facilitator family transporter [Pelistega sp.]
MASTPAAEKEGLALARKQAASKSTWVSVIVNLLLSILQIVIGIFAASAALISDAIHSLSDLVSDFVVLIANKFSDVPADDTHPYGHYRFENIASLFIGLLLLAVGIGMIWGGGERLLGGTANLPTVHYSALIVAGVVLIAKELLFRYLLAVGKKVDSSMLIVNAWHARSDALSSLIVLVAIVANLAGISWADIVASIIVGTMITKMGAEFTWKAMHELSDHATDAEEIQAISDIITSTPGVLGFHQLRTRKSGDFIHVDVHLEFPGTMSVKEAHDISLLVSHRLKEKENIIEIVTHFDPV